MSRKPCCVGEGLKKGAWTTEEDKKLISYIHENGEGSWRDMPLKAGLKRCGKSCRLRWANYLKPDIKRGEFSHEEEQIIIMLHASRGNKWSVIARHLPRRTDNEVKNYWNTHLKKRLIDQGIDPVTHKPLVSNPNPTPSILKEDDSSNNQGKSDEQSSQSGSLSSPISLPLEISSSDDHDKGFLTSKKRCFRRSSSTSKLLNKVATRASSIGNILSASMEGTLFNSTTPLLYCLQHACLNNDHDLSETSQIHIEESGPIFSENMINYDIKEDLGMDFDINNSEYDFSQFLEHLSHNNGEEEAENIQDHLIFEEVSSASVDEDDIMMQNINGWSTYLVDHSEFVYDMDQDYDEDKIR
ncbi:unnamed protein product [Cochlearia groenlandica]